MLTASMLPAPLRRLAEQALTYDDLAPIFRSSSWLWLSTPSVRSGSSLMLRSLKLVVSNVSRTSSSPIQHIAYQGTPFLPSLILETADLASRKLSLYAA
jgi:hypothetical protein